MKIMESAENYLERILILEKKKGTVQSIDIARDMNFSRPSISVAMKRLREEGMITMDESNAIKLTAKGREIAEMIYERHLFLAEAFMSLGVDEDTAIADACKIEHVISPITFEKIKTHLAAFRKQPE